MLFVPKSIFAHSSYISHAPISMPFWIFSSGGRKGNSSVTPLSEVSLPHSSMLDGLVLRCFGMVVILLDDTLPETNSSPPKMDGWNTTFLLGRSIFRGYVSFREGTYKHSCLMEVPGSKGKHYILSFTMNLTDT